MKRFFLVFFSIALLSCTEGDDNNPNKISGQYNAELINESPWIYKKIEIIEIIENSSTPKDEEEIINIIDQKLMGLSYDFKNVNSGDMKSQDGEKYDFNYVLNQLGNVIFSGEYNAKWLKLEIEEGELSFISNYTENLENENITVKAKFFFN